MKPHHNKLLEIDAKVFVILTIILTAIFYILGAWWIGPILSLILTVIIHFFCYDLIEFFTEK